MLATAIPLESVIQPVQFELITCQGSRSPGSNCIMSCRTCAAGDALNMAQFRSWDVVTSFFNPSTKVRQGLKHLLRLFNLWQTAGAQALGLTGRQARDFEIPDPDMWAKNPKPGRRKVP